MDDIKGFVKKYWPYLLGGVVGLYLILRYSAGSSGSSSGDAGYGAFLQAQTAAASQNAAAQLQAQAQANQLALDSKALDAQIAFNTGQLNVTRDKNIADAYNNFQTTQAAMAGAIGSSTAQIIGALNAPAITAMQAGAIENAAALEAAGNVAANSFLAQGSVVGSSAQTAGQMASVFGSPSFGAQEQKTDWAGIINAASNAYSTYMTGGMMNNSGGGGSTFGGGNFGSTNQYGSGSFGGGSFGSSKYGGNAWGGA